MILFRLFNVVNEISWQTYLCFMVPEIFKASQRENCINDTKKALNIFSTNKFNKSSKSFPEQPAT